MVARLSPPAHSIYGPSVLPPKQQKCQTRTPGIAEELIFQFP